MNEITSPLLIESQNKPRVFRIKKSYRNQGLLLVIFFLFAGIGSTYGIWIDAPPDRRLYGAAFIFLFYSFWTLGSVWMILAYKYESLTIQHETIIQQGVIFRKAIDLSTIKQAHWKLGNKGGITLKSMAAKISINLDNFEMDEQLWLIRYFQSTLPEDIQDNWDLFCTKIAIPLRDYAPDKIPIPGPDEILITRKRWTKIFIPIILITAILSVSAAWYLQTPRLLLAPVFLIILCLIFRYMVPKQGYVSRSVQETNRLMVFLGWWFTVGVIVFLVFKLIDFPEPQNTIAVFCSLFVWMTVYITKLCRSSRNIQQKDLEIAKEAVKKWDSEVGPQSEE